MAGYGVDPYDAYNTFDSISLRSWDNEHFYDWAVACCISYDHRPLDGVLEVFKYVPVDELLNSGLDYFVQLLDAQTGPLLFEKLQEMIYLEKMEREGDFMNQTDEIGFNQSDAVDFFNQRDDIGFHQSDTVAYTHNQTDVVNLYDMGSRQYINHINHDVVYHSHAEDYSNRTDEVSMHELGRLEENYFTEERIEDTTTQYQPGPSKTCDEEPLQKADSPQYFRKLPSKSPKGKRVRYPWCWEYLLRLLLNPDPCSGALIEWVDEEEGVFRLLQKEKIAELWGHRVGKTITYPNFSRLLRYHYGSSLLKVKEKKLIYQFAPHIMLSLRNGSLRDTITNIF